MLKVSGAAKYGLACPSASLANSPPVSGADDAIAGVPSYPSNADILASIRFGISPITFISCSPGFRPPSPPSPPKGDVLKEHLIDLLIPLIPKYLLLTNICFISAVNITPYASQWSPETQVKFLSCRREKVYQSTSRAMEARLNF